MSVVELKQEISASKEAYFSWEIALPSGITFKKGMLYLTDIEQDELNKPSAIFKYQLHSTESPAGSHIFEVSHVGDYYARLTIIGSDESIYASDLKTVTVYELGPASISSVTSRDSGFTIMLNPYNGPTLQSDQSILTVNFVLFGREKTSTGYGASSVSINIAQTYKDINDINYNKYIIEGDTENEITNGWQYEIACFYTDNKVISGDLSDTVVSIPTNKPNKITELSAEYDYSNQKLLINYSNPDDYLLWTPLTLRAKIIINNVTTTEYIFDANSPNFTFDGEQIEFDINSVPTLPIDLSFNITLNISNTFGYSDYESDSITCIVPQRFCSEPLTITDKNYIVGDGVFSVTYNKSTLSKYNVSVYIIVTDVEDNIIRHEGLYESADIIDLDNGKKHTARLKVFYNASFDNNIEIGPCTEEIDYHDYNFIPHGQANAPEFLDTVYGDGNAILSWSTPTDLRGYYVDHYEVSNTNGLTWFSVGENTTHSISCGTNYTSGNIYIFKVKVFTKSPDSDFEDGEEIKEGTASHEINVYPLQRPSALTVNEHIPGSQKCDIKFTVGDIKDGNIDKFNYYTTNPGTPTEMNASRIDNTSQYSYSFENLSNTESSILYVSVVTISGNNTQESDLVNFTTSPYEMPITPNLSAKPNTTSVELSWPANNPIEILTQTVEYDVQYKVAVQGSEWILSSGNYTLNIQTNIYTLNIGSLTSNTEYKFRIRSKIYNDELFQQNIDSTKTSEYSTEITSRPFVYSNTPTMNLRVDNKTIIVDLTRSLANYYPPHAYHATVARSDNQSVILQAINITTEDISQTLTFNLNNVDLVNLDLYTVVAWYDMVITGESYSNHTTVPYNSDIQTNATVIPFNPAIVPILNCTPSDDRINLSWDDGNMTRLTITKYQVSSKLSTVSEWSSFADFSPNMYDTDAQNTNNYNIDMLQDNGASKDYKIRAVILDAGNTYYSVSNIVTVTPFKNANAPILDSYVSSSGKIILNWLALSPEELNGLPLLCYEVKKTGDTEWTQLNTSLTHEFSGLTNGTNYTFYVRAVTNNSINSANLGYVHDIVSTNQLSQTARPYADPTITLDSVVSTNATTLTLYWTPYLGGRNLDHYEIYYNTESSTTTSSNKYYEISPLTTGTAYECSVKIYVIDQNDNAPKDANGVNLLVYTQSLVKTNIPYLPAIAPTIVTSVPNNTFVDVTWNDLSLEQLRGLPLKHYQVNYKVGNNFFYTLLQWQNIPFGDLSHRFNGLTNGTEYTFYVQAVTQNEHFESDPGKENNEVIGAENSNYNIPYYPLAAPSSVTCEPGASRAILNWVEPSFIGLTLSHYEVTGGNLTEPAKIYSPDTSYLCQGLLNNTQYYFNVKAFATHQYAGEIISDYSTQVSTIPYQRPDNVANVVCSAINGVLTIYFTNPTTSSINNGLPQDYKYTLNGGDYNDVYPGQPISITSFGSGDITVGVFARIHNPNDANSSSNSVYSYASTVVVSNSNLASDIQNLTASPGDKSVTLNWENVNANSGSSYGIVHITDSGSKSLLKTLTFSSGQALTTTITSLADGSLLENGKLYTFHVYASEDDVLKISATPIGVPIFNSLTNSGSAFTTDIDLNGSTRVDVSIVAIEISGVIDFISASFTTRVNTIQYNISNTYTSAAVFASNSVGQTRSSQIIF